MRIFYLLLISSILIAGFLFQDGLTQEKTTQFRQSVIELKCKNFRKWSVTPDLNCDGLNEFIIQKGRKLDIYQQDKNKAGDILR